VLGGDGGIAGLGDRDEHVKHEVSPFPVRRGTAG
jgi:hypothetical protein